MDIQIAKEHLDKVRLNLSIQASETSDQWSDSMRYRFYSQVVDHYNPVTINYVGQFEESLRELDSIISQLNECSENK